MHLHARGRAERARVDARAGDDHHPEAGDAAPRLVVRRDHAPQQVVADARTAHADHADDLVVGVPEPVPQRLAVGRVGPLPHHVAGEVEVLLGPRPGRRQVRPQRQVDHVGRVADEHRPVAQRGVPRDVLDHLGVVVGGQERLPLAAVGHRHPADEVGHPDERRPLELGVLVQEVVEVPGLVAHPEVERLPLHQVVEDHEVVDQHLVHPAHGLERVQVVLARLRLEVPRLARQQARGRVHDLAALLEELRHRRLGQPLDLEVGPPLAHRVGDGQVAAHVAEPDGRGEVERPRPTPRAAHVGDAAAAGAPVTRSTKPLMARLTTTGSRAIGRWPEPSSTSCSATGPAGDGVWARPSGWQRSSVPWITSTGAVDRAQQRLGLRRRPRGTLAPSRTASCTCPVVAPVRTRRTSSSCLVECGSHSIWSKKNGGELRPVRPPEVPVGHRTSPRTTAARPRSARRPRPGTAAAACRPRAHGATATTPWTRSGCRRRDQHRLPGADADARPARRARRRAASITATVSATNSRSPYAAGSVGRSERPLPARVDGDDAVVLGRGTAPAPSTPGCARSCRSARTRTVGRRSAAASLKVS